MAASHAMQGDAALYFGPAVPTGTDFGDNASHIVTSDGTASGTVLELWKFDAETGLWVMIPAGGMACPAPMTRGALISLRNSGQLMPGCPYSITDYSRGCLSGNVATITMMATSANGLSMSANVQTSFDNQSWRGLYDIDTHRIISLEDNRGNRASGQAGNEVDRFPWGNTGWQGVVVDNAVVTVDCNTAFRIRNSRFESNASVTLTGASGYIYDSNISNGAIIALVNAGNVAIQNTVIHSRARLYANGVNTLTLYYHNQTSEAYWYVENQADVRSYYSNFSSAARIYYYGGTRHWFYYTTVKALGYIRQYDGDGRYYYCDVSNYGFVTINNGAGLSIIAGSQVQNRSTLTLNAATRVYYSSFNSQSTFTVNGGMHYANDMSARSNVTTSFNTQGITTTGNFTQTLSANNTNTYRGYGQNSLI
ncbi:MAG: hypothetical protein ACPGVT_11980 [Maricaulaceae bacterium]